MTSSSPHRRGPLAFLLAVMGIGIIITAGLIGLGLLGVQVPTRIADEGYYGLAHDWGVVIAGFSFGLAMLLYVFHHNRPQLRHLFVLVGIAGTVMMMVPHLIKG